MNFWGLLKRVFFFNNNNKYKLNWSASQGFEHHSVFTHFLLESTSDILVCLLLWGLTALQHDLSSTPPHLGQSLRCNPLGFRWSWTSWPWCDQIEWKVWKWWIMWWVISYVPDNLPGVHQVLNCLSRSSKVPETSNTNRIMKDFIKACKKFKKFIFLFLVLKKINSLLDNS